MVKSRRLHSASFTDIRRYCRVVARLSHTVARRSTGEVIVEIVECPKAHGVAGFARGAAQMRQQKGIGQGAVSWVNVWFIIEDVAVFTTMAPRGRVASVWALTDPRVSVVEAQLMDRKSDCARSPARVG